ncbi:MAG TPA: hypothetical protein VMR50_20800 [Myxococcota bacterium]|nr:hypothetical protein [Myxococcota bacterium]
MAVQGKFESEAVAPAGGASSAPGFAWVAVVGLVGTCLAIWLAAWTKQGFPSVWPRFEDDAYYYLVIARNAAAGHGFTMDGIALTNGFQPLWMWALIPVAWLTSGDTQLLYTSVQVASVAIFCALGGVLCAFLRSLVGLRAALIGTAVLLVPPFLNVLLSGLESGFAIGITVLLVVELWSSQALEQAEPRLRDTRVGALLGLLLLARLDAIFVALALAAEVTVLGLYGARGAFGARLVQIARRGLVMFGPAVVGVAPYLLWNFTRFGHWVPISGALKSSHGQLGWMPENVALPYQALLLLGLFGVAVAFARPADRRLGRILLPIAAGLVVHTLHTVVLMRWAVFAWHYALFIPLGAISAALIFRRVEERMPVAVSRAAVTAVALFLAGAQWWSISRLHLDFTPATREAGEWVARTLPANAVLGMKDSGAFSYFSQRAVVNMDGVANSFEYEETLCRGQLAKYLADHHVAYIAQHAVPEAKHGTYQSLVLHYPCHFEGGRESELSLERANEVFRGTPYHDYHENEHQLVIWRIAPLASPKP